MSDDRRIIHEITPLMGKDVLYIADRHKKEFTYPIHNHSVFELNFVENAKGVRRIVGDSQEIIGDYDLSEIQQIKSMQDNNDYSKDTDISAKQKKLQAAHFFDSGIEHAKKALKLKTGTDAELIYTMCISSNCTVKNTAYLFANGLKVASIAKKAIKLDPKNAGAYYYQYAQDLYAPEFFANYKRGYQKMSEYFSDENLYFELFERFNFMTAIAYAFYKLGDMQNSIEWYKKALLIYPGNSNANQMITTISESLNKN